MIQPQNIYDNPEFFEGYKTLRQNDAGLNGALEVPALRALLPALSGMRVLDLGCGFGDFARYASEQNAALITAIDVSEKMLSEAARMTDSASIRYLNCAIEDYTPDPDAFDLAVSSMALHYIEDFGATTKRIFDGLRAGGRFIFSVEHPVCTAYPVGWIRDQHGAPVHWPLDQYEYEGERRTSWFVDGVTKYHRTVATYVSTLLQQGFVIAHLGEPGPMAGLLQERPALAEMLRRPPVLLLAAAKPDA